MRRLAELTGSPFIGLRWDADVDQWVLSVPFEGRLLVSTSRHLPRCVDMVLAEVRRIRRAT